MHEIPTFAFQIVEAFLQHKLVHVHSPSMKTERLYFFFWSKNEGSHLCMDSTIFCPKHVGTTHHWKDLQIYTQFLLLLRLDHEVKSKKSRGHSQI